MRQIDRVILTLRGMIEDEKKIARAYDRQLQEINNRTTELKTERELSRARVAAYSNVLAMIGEVVYRRGHEDTDKRSDIRNRGNGRIHKVGKAEAKEPDR